MSKKTSLLTLEIAGSVREFEVEVTYQFYRAIKGARDSLGGVRGAGPPLEPDEPAHCEVDGAVIRHGTSVIDLLKLELLSDEQITAIECECFEDHDG